MKRLVKYLILIVAVVGFSTYSRGQTLPSAALAFNPSGDYHPITLPSIESDKFIQFDLELKRIRGRLIASGAVKGVQPWYRFTATVVTEDDLKFSTAKVAGISYDFNGKFLGKGDFAGQWPGEGITMLEGTLPKFVNGKKAWEIKTSFVYYPGC